MKVRATVALDVTANDIIAGRNGEEQGDYGGSAHFLAQYNQPEFRKKVKSLDLSGVSSLSSSVILPRYANNPLAAPVQSARATRRDTNHFTHNETPRSRNGLRSARPEGAHGGSAGTSSRPQTGGFTSREEREKAKQIRVKKAKEESARLSAARALQKDEIKQQCSRERERELQAERDHARELNQKFKKKYDRSPFKIDLVAESERIDEELRIRTLEEQRRVRLMEMKKQKVKHDIIMRVLSESNDIEAMRKQRQQMEEEERKHAILEKQHQQHLRSMQRSAASRRANGVNSKADLRAQKIELQEAEVRRRREKLLQQLQKGMEQHDQPLEQ